MTWEEDFRRNIERTRQRIMEIAPDMLDLNAHRCSAVHPPPRAGAQSTRGAIPCTSTAEPSFIARFRTPRAPPVSPTDETSAVDPLRPGPYPTCASAPTVAHVVGSVPVQIVAYAPGTQISPNMCESATKDCPLVVLFHARGASISYLSYEKLSRHLASYGFVVVSVDWLSVETYAEDGLLLPSILESVNGGLLGLINILSGQLVLLGHSNGGFIVDRSVNPGLSKTGFKLSAVVLMSPSGSTINSNTYTTPLIDALLVLHDVLDGDPGANGGDSAPKTTVSGCGVLAYELAGYPNGGNANASNPQLLKHFVYAHVQQAKDILSDFTLNYCPDANEGTHYYQDTPIALGYILAFLLAYARGHATYRVFFRRQQPMPDITDVLKLDGVPGIWHMHAEPSESVLIDWASPMAMANVSGGFGGVISLPQEDEHSLNHGRVFWVQFNRGTECSVYINLSPTAKFKEFDSISFGLCQSNIAGYDNKGSPATDGALMGTISLRNSQTSQAYSVKLADVGGGLWYHGCLDNRRVCMEDRALPLSWVAKMVSLESIDQIILRFAAIDHFGKKAEVLVGNIKLVGKGP